MSGTGSLLIRNLRKSDDYSKAVKAQDELLRIAIANDAKIASARKAYYKDEIPPLTQEQQKDPAELQADQAKQEADLIRNLQSLGFRYKDIQQIVGSLTPDIEFKVNQTFPAIKRRLEKDYKVELITPSFFLDWLSKYLDTLDRSKGFISGGSSSKPSASSKFDIGGGDEAVADLADEEAAPAAIAVVGEPTRRPQKAQAIYSSIEDFRDADIGDKKRFLNKYLTAYLESAPELSPQEEANIQEAFDAINNSQGSSNSNPNYERKGKGGVLTEIYALWSPTVFNRLREIGSDLVPMKKEGEGILKNVMRKKGLKAIKIGKGIVVEEQPVFRPLGKYLIHYGFLTNQDMLNVKYPSGGVIPQFKPTPVSDIFKDFIIDLLDSGKANSRIYDQLPIDERKLFEKVATGAGIFHSLKLKKTITDTDRDENDRFNLLKGEYLAGNNSPKVLQELRRLVIKFMNDGRIHKSQGINFLMELSI
jgi:hypothetical protein